MNIYPVSQPTAKDISNIPVENLAGNKNLSEDQKIAEVSRQFEAIMLRQILSEAQKPVITSEFTDNSAEAGIYQDFTTNALADSMSKAGTLGLAKVFDQQLTHHAHGNSATSNPGHLSPGPALAANQHLKNQPPNPVTIFTPATHE